MKVREVAVREVAVRFMREAWVLLSRAAGDMNWSKV